uniref:CUB domain-containing protein n=1 Tax=Ditylenchus dipsaci TaxID=166011 RepID=A0A915DDI7_9BILA
MINLRYCSRVCSRNLDCQAGGYTNPNNCSQCKCPDGYSGVTCQQVASSNRAACRGGELAAGTNGITITSPNVDSRADCYWRIRAPSNQRVELTVSRVNFPCRDACTSYVELKYRSDKTSTGARLCCGTPRRTIISENTEVVLIFHGEDSMPSGYQGFSISYRAVSPNTQPTTLTSTTDITGSTTTTTKTTTSSPTGSGSGEPAEWSDWAAWSICSVSCGGCGKKRRVRACYGGNQQCSGPAFELDKCGQQTCPISEKTTRCTGRLLMPCDLLAKLDFGTVLNAGLEINNDISKKNNSTSPTKPDSHLLDTPKNAATLRRIRRSLHHLRQKRFVVGDKQLDHKIYCEKRFTYNCPTSLLTISMDWKVSKDAQGQDDRLCCSGYYASKGQCYPK